MNFTVKVFVKNNNKQSDESRDGRTDSGSKKIFPVPPTLVSVVLKAVKANPILWLLHQQQQFIGGRESDDLQTCIDDETMVSFVSYVTQVEWKHEFSERFISRKVPDARKGFQMKMFHFVE